MLEYDVCEKLIELYNSAGLKPSTGSISLGEIKGVSAGANLIFDMINVSNNLAGHSMLKMANSSIIRNDFTGVYKEIFNDQVKLNVYLGYDVRLMSKVDKEYFTPFTEIIVDGVGMTWDDLDYEDNSWRDIEKIDFRFSMWEYI